MTIKEKNGILEIKTEIYQAKNGGVFINFARGPIKIEKFYADSICYDIPDFDLDLYKKFYETPNQ